MPIRRQASQHRSRRVAGLNDSVSIKAAVCGKFRSTFPERRFGVRESSVWLKCRAQNSLLSDPLK